MIHNKKTQGSVRIDICICTFRRPFVAETLRSVALLKTMPGWQIGIIVADNDDRQSAKALIEQTAADHALLVTYIHAPARNISIARNACLEASSAPYLAFIDDDERVTAQWLCALFHELTISNADAVLGPVQAIYGPESPDWLRRGDFLSTRPVWTGGEIITGYAGNALLKRTAPALRNLRFRPALGRIGGEDTIFFFDFYKAGGKITFTPEAIVTENVPASRMEWRWLLNRRYRCGMTHGLLILGAKGDKIAVRLTGAALAGVKSGICLGAALLTITQPDRSRRWVLRAALHTGVITRLLGARAPELYGV